MTSTRHKRVPERLGRTWPIHTHIDINAPADLVWSIITDPDSFPVWNPFIPSITLRSDQVRAGVEFDLDCQMTETQLLRGEKEVVLEVDPQQRVFRIGTSRTRGRPGIISNRSQQCLARGARTRYINYEEFSGVLGPLVTVLYRRNLKRAFERHNLALKRHAESLHRRRIN